MRVEAFRLTSVWTEELVEYRLESAAHTLRAWRASGLAPSGQVCAWPAIVRDFWEQYGQDRTRITRPVPTGAAIDEAEEAFAWLFYLSEDSRTIVWARANGVKWGDLSGRLRRSARTLRYHYRDAIRLVVKSLNDQLLSKK